MKKFAWTETNYDKITNILKIIQKQHKTVTRPEVTDAINRLGIRYLTAARVPQIMAEIERARPKVTIDGIEYKTVKDAYQNHGGGVSRSTFWRIVSAHDYKLTTKVLQAQIASLKSRYTHCVIIDGKKYDSISRAYKTLNPPVSESGFYALVREHNYELNSTQLVNPAPKKEALFLLKLMA